MKVLPTRGQKNSQEPKGQYSYNKRSSHDDHRAGQNILTLAPSYIIDQILDFIYGFSVCLREFAIRFRYQNLFVKVLLRAKFKSRSIHAS